MKNKTKKGAAREVEQLGLEDSRFSHLKSDPKFAGLSNINRKVVIEKRFAAALTDEKFSSRAKVDKRGKKLKKTTGNELLDLYELEADNEKSDADEPAPKKTKKEKLPVQPEESEDSAPNDSESEGKPFKMDLARGEGNLSSSDEDSDDESDWELPGDIKTDMELEQLDNEAERVEWASCRLAVCNLDWDIIKAEDILILVRSFKPDGGVINSISIYLSDIGKERLEEEEKYGPRLQLSKPLDEYDEDTIDPETKLAYRKFQLDRLKYYYAVIDCNNEETASAIYEQCDGFQFETTGLKMDLRFIPDDMEFEEDRLKERIREEDLNIQKYKSKEKVRAGVTQTKSTIDWDQDDEVRQRKMQEAFENDDNDGHDLIAGSDSEGDEESKKQRRDALLSLLVDAPKNEGLSVDWHEEKGNKAEISDDDEESGSHSDGNESDESAGSDIDKALARRDKKSDASDKTKDEVVEEKPKKTNAFKNYQAKKKLKRTERKEEALAARELEKEAMQAVGEEAKNRVKEKLKKKKVAAAGRRDVTDEIAADDRFKALFTDSSFAIEQSSKEFKGSKLIQKQAEVKRDAKDKAVAEVKTTGSDLLSKLKSKAEKFNEKKQKKRK